MCMARGGRAVVDQDPGMRASGPVVLVPASEATDPDSLWSVARARLSPPRTQAEIVERNRLFERLDAGVRLPLTVVTGPPGAGKTVLVSRWAERRARSGAAAWLSIDSSEIDDAQFWRSVLDAMQTAGEPGLQSLAARLPVGGPGFLPEFANALSSLATPVVLILDDFHELRAPGVSHQLDSLLRHAPERLRLVIVSRTDPRLSLHRLHLEGKLTEVRTAELAFTVPEAAAIFELAGIELTADQVLALHDRTEGWAAGLRLAALSLEGYAEVAEVVRTFAGDDGSVADYFVEQVLEHASPEVRSFMLKTSVVDVMTPGLVDAMFGQPIESRRLLDQLDRSGAFVTRTGFTYRYHVMFRELLRSQLRHRMPDTYFLQHRRAARWYAQHRLNVMAIRHSIEAKDWALAASLVTTNWLPLMARGEALTLREMITQLPRQSVVRDPELALATAATLLVSGEREQAGEYLRLADHRASSVRSNRRIEFGFARMVTRQYEAQSAGDMEGAILASRKLLAGHGADALALEGHERRALALLNLGVAETWVRERGQARTTLENALALARFGHSDYLAFCASASLGLLEALSGQLQRSVELSKEAVDLGERFGWLRLPAAARGTCALAICAYHRNAISEATAYLARADAAVRGSPDRPVSVIVQLVRALIAIRGGDGEAAGIAIHTAMQDAADWQMPPALAAALASAEAGALIAAGRSADAIAAVGSLRDQGRFAEGEVGEGQARAGRGRSEERCQRGGRRPGGRARLPATRDVHRTPRDRRGCSTSTRR